MERELIESYLVFKASLQKVEWHLKVIDAERFLLEKLQRSEKTSRVNITALSILICVALQISLVRLLESWGITPSAVTSHSSDEIATTYTAEALILEQAMIATHYRAALAANSTMRAAGEKDGMLAVGLGAVKAQEYVNNLASGGRAVVACISSPDSVIIAGDVNAVKKLEKTCKQASVFSRRLRVDTDYHSHHMQPIAQLYLDLLRKNMSDDDTGDDDEPGYDALNVSFSSPVTDGRITSMRQIAAPEYWVDSLTQPVEFVQAFTDMILSDTDQSGSSNVNVDVLLEVDPHTALAAPIRKILSLPEFEGFDISYYDCLIRKEHAEDSMRSTAVNLLREGLQLDMHRINFPHREPTLCVLTDLPSYPWNHSNKH